MSKSAGNRLTRPETLTAIGLLAGAAALLAPTAQLRTLSALLPATMLVAMIVLAAIMLLGDQRKASAGEPAAPMMKAPRRVLTAFFLIVLYAVAVEFVGFYVCTAVSVPLVAFIFGYRNPIGLALATLIVVGAIYLIFGYAMSREFPAGVLWAM